MRAPLRTLALVSALLATSAWAQATRTWVSGVGDDGNPCSRTAPCRTFAGAISKTAAGGEVSTLGPGSFGSVTITKAITLDGLRAGARITASGSSGITINAPGAAVTLRHLEVMGLSGASVGIRFLAGAALHLEGVSVRGFARGVSFDPSLGGALFLRDVSLTGNTGEGLTVGSDGGTAAAVIERSSFQHNGTGLLAGPGAKVTVRGGAASGNVDAGVSLAAGDQGSVDLNLEGTSLTGNGVGLASSATGGAATARLSKALIAGNTVATTALTGEGRADSFGNNRIVGGSSAACPQDALSVSPASLPAGALDVPYPRTPFTAFGALGAPGFAQSGALPAGMTFAHGMLSGTPTHAGSYPLTVSATDGNGCTASAALTLEVACPGLSLEPDTVPAGTTGTDYGPVAFSFDGGGSGASTWSLDGGLPIGLGFDGGVLAGFPTEPGSFPFTLTVEDPAGCSTGRDYTLEIAAGAGFQPTTLALTSATPSSTYGEPISLSAVLTHAAGAPTGTVRLFEGSAKLGTATLADGGAAFEVSSLSAGTHTLTAIYSGDATFGGSRATGPELTVAQAGTSTTLGVQTGPDGALLIATVTSADSTPAGTVRFDEGSTSLGSAALDGAGTARLPISLARGSHTFTATYEGATNWKESTSDPVTYQVADGDAGTPDAGTPDGGTPPSLHEDTGCGCNQTGGGYPFALGMLALWAFARRERRPRAG
jgi:hypothetical protein